MADANVSHLGQIQGTGGLDTLWLTVFSGEVLTAFELSVKLRGMVRSRQISGAKSAQFPATFRVETRYHTPGSEILGQDIQKNQMTISLDDLTISDTFVDQIEELKSQYDYRAVYATEHGRSQATFYDRVISNVLVRACRDTTELFQGDGAGSSIVDTTDLGSSADFTSSGADLISGLNLAKQRLDENLVPVETMPLWALVKPAHWYLMANSDHNLNRLFNQEGASVARQVLRTVSDINIVKSNAPLFGYKVLPWAGGADLGIVAKGNSGLNGTTPVPGTDCPTADKLPYGQPIQFNYPSKYQSDQTNTIGVVWTEPAMGMLQLLGLSMETVWDPRRQGTLMIAKQAIGADVLRAKCAVELQKHS